MMCGATSRCEAEPIAAPDRIAGDVYAATYQVNFDKAAMMKSLVPNLTFTVAMSLYVIFKYKHREKEGGRWM